MHRGSCLCGAVRFEVDGDLAPPDACHCTLCRRHSGHFFVSTDVPRDAAMGAFDGPTGTRIGVHIHVADKGDYYDIGDGLPRKEH